MMKDIKKIIEYDSPLWEWLSAIFDYMLLNLLWLLCSVPVITAGAAIAALQSVCTELHGSCKPAIIKGFFSAFKRSLKPTLGLWCLYILAAGWQLLCIYIARAMPLAIRTIIQICCISILFILLLSIIPTFATSVCFNHSTIWHQAYSGVTIALYHLPRSIAALGANMIPAVLVFFFPRIIVVLLLFWLLGGQVFLFDLANRIIVVPSQSTKKEI